MVSFRLLEALPGKAFEFFGLVRTALSIDDSLVFQKLNLLISVEC